MGIRPPSDIVLDVARAADPTRYQAAARKLTELAAGTNPAEFGDTFGMVAGRGLNVLPNDPYLAATAFRNATALSSAQGAKNPHQQFEAFVLQSFVESMLPKDSETVFGKGTAGGIWKSMLAEQIGAQIAKAGGIGIARQIMAAHPAPDHKPVLGGTADPAIHAGT